MNMFKRMASIVLFAIMLLQTVAFAAPLPEDVVGTEYESAASMLCALDIMVGDGKNFNPDDDITRAEFAQIMMKSLALDAATDSFSPKGIFTDVDEYNIFAPAIELGVGIGAIKGYGDGTFGPNDNVKGTEAIKMMIYAVGHHVVAEAEGSYPAGYMAVAQQIGMLKGLSSVNFFEPMTRGQAAILCANALKVDMKQKITAGDKITYIETDGVNLLFEKHNTYKVEGLVTANDITSMFQASTLREGRVQIEGTTNAVYFEGETTVSDALGKYIRAYCRYDEDAGESTVLSYEVLDNMNNVQTIDLANINFNTVTDTYVEYWEDDSGRVSKINIAPSMVSIIYNGTVRTRNTTVSSTFAEINGREGEVTFIDNNGDNKVDVLIITAYETFVINKINEKDFILTDKLGTYVSGRPTPVKKEIVIDVESKSLTAEIVDIEGEELEFADLAVDDVLSIAMSDDGLSRQYAKIIVSQESVDGTITEIGQKNGKYTFVIDGEKYEITDTYFNYITKGLGLAAPQTSLTVGLETNGTFYLDAFNKIAFDEIAGVSEDAYFGVLRRYAPGKGAETALKLRIYVDGAYTDYYAANNVVVDGVLRKGDAVKTALDNSITEIEKTVKYYDTISGMTAILFELDEDDKIISIDTPYMNTLEGESAYSLQPVKAGGKISSTIAFQSGIVYLSSSGTIGGATHPLLASAPIITLPGEASNVDIEKNLSLIRRDKLPAKVSEAVPMQLFTTEPDSYQVRYAVAQKEASNNVGTPTSSAWFELHMLVVSSVTQCLDDEDQKTVAIVGLQNGSEMEYIVDPEYYQSGDFYRDIWTNTTTKYYSDAVPDPARKGSVVLPGDALRVNTNALGQVVWAEPLYLSDVKIVRMSGLDKGLDEGERYNPVDLALVNELTDDAAKMSYLVDKTSVNGNDNITDKVPGVGGGSIVYAQLTTNDKGFLIKSTSANSNNAYDKPRTVFNEATNSYIYGDTGVTFDASYNPENFQIVVYDYTTSEVYKGTASDLNDTSSSHTPASVVLLTFRGSSAGSTIYPRAMYIIKF